jgi:hypothetical protein
MAVSQKVRVIAVAAVSYWNHAALSSCMMTYDQFYGKLRLECLKWKNITNHSRTYKSYWVWWNSMVVRGGLL